MCVHLDTWTFPPGRLRTLLEAAKHEASLGSRSLKINPYNFRGDFTLLIFLVTA